MKILTLSIKRQWFDLIRSGEKKVETREVRASIAHRYIEYVDEKTGKVYERFSDIPEEAADNCEARPIKYDALKLLTGAYNVKPRPYIIVQVTGAKLFFLTDENDDLIVYEYEGEEFVAAEIDYQLGEILEDKGDI